jgi:hypothetical protein
VLRSAPTEIRGRGAEERGWELRRHQAEESLVLSSSRGRAALDFFVSVVCIRRWQPNILCCDGNYCARCKTTNVPLILHCLIEVCLTKASVLEVMSSTQLRANLPRFNGVVLSVIGYVPVDSETFVMTSSCVGSIFEDAHKSTVCVCVLMDVRLRCDCLGVI